MDLRRFSILRIISTVVLAFFIWTFGGVFDITYAIKVSQKSEVRTQKSKNPKPEEKFNKALEDIEQIITNIKDKAEVEVKAEKNKLKAKKTEIETLDVEIKKQFKETEEKIKGLPEVIKKRHKDFVKHYEDNLNELNSNLDAIDKAKGKGEVEAEVEKAKKHLEKVKPPKKHRPLDPNKLPHRAAEEKEVPIEEITPEQAALLDKEFAEIYSDLPTGQAGSSGIQYSELGTQNFVQVASISTLHGLLPQIITQAVDPPPSASSGVPTAADLEETIEVQFTEAIQVKAEELGNNPHKIYEWVRNNIEFVSTYGSIQGADYCLQTKLCNAFDTASLLIALLRVSGVHARYVQGTIELPIEKVMNWAGGFTDKMSALRLFASAGVPTSGITVGGEIKYARIEHVWVEAFVDYIPSRGARHKTGQGDTWIRLDASFKQYEYIDRLDVNTAVPTDYEALFAEVSSLSTINTEIPSITGLPTETIQNQITDFKNRLDEYLSINLPEVDTYYELRDTLHGYRNIMQKDFKFLLGTLPSRVISKNNTFSEIPQNLRHKLSLNLINENILINSNPLLYNTSLPELAGKRITLSYIPATPNDEQVMSDAEGILNFPLYLVQVIPELKIEGQTVATGGIIGMGQEQTFQISFSRPGGNTDRVNNSVQAGEYYAVGLNVSKVNFQYLYDRVNIWQPDTAEDRDDRLGELLYLTSMFYFARSDHFKNELELSSDIASVRHPSESIVGMKLYASYIFGAPMLIDSVGLNMDVDRDIISPVSKTDGSNSSSWFMIQKGLFSSALEHFLFEYLMDFEAVSAVKFLDLASQQNIPIYIIDSENIQRVDELAISSVDKQDIRNFINTGKTILVPQSEIQYLDYSGIGYAAIDAKTGAGAYMITGGYAGGETVREISEYLLKLGKQLINNDIVALPYETTILAILNYFPDVADSPVEDFPEFKEWAERILFLVDRDFEGGGMVMVIIGQQILYNLQIMLIGLEVDMIYKNKEEGEL
jgi:hypothetical protein